MEQKCRLLPVQVENLKKQYEESYHKLRKLNVLKGEEFADKKVAANNEINFGLDTSLLGALTIITRDYKEAQKILANYEIIEPESSNVIGLGSTFEAKMNYDGLEESELFTLVEVHVTGDDPNMISVNSPLGHAVLGATVGDTVSYMVGKERITGTVTGIVKEKQKTL